jgi:hypothetical protein
VIFLSTTMDSIFGLSSPGRAGVSKRADFAAAKIAVFAASIPFGGRWDCLLWELRARSLRGAAERRHASIIARRG